MKFLKNSFSKFIILMLCGSFLISNVYSMRKGRQDDPQKEKEAATANQEGTLSVKDFMQHFPELIAKMYSAENQALNFSELVSWKKEFSDPYFIQFLTSYLNGQGYTVKNVFVVSTQLKKSDFDPLLQSLSRNLKCPINLIISPKPIDLMQLAIFNSAQQYHYKGKVQSWAESLKQLQKHTIVTGTVLIGTAVIFYFYSSGIFCGMLCNK